MDELTYRDMIDLYLDGVLPSEQRSVLFSALASSEELQTDFHRALAIRLASSHHAQTLIPPPEVSARILAAAAPAAEGIVVRLRRLTRTATFRTALATAAALTVGFVVGRISAPESVPSPLLPTTTAASSMQKASSSPPQPPIAPKAAIAQHPRQTIVPAPIASDSATDNGSTEESPLVSIEHADAAAPTNIPLPARQNIFVHTIAAPSAAPTRRTDALDLLLAESPSSELALSVRRTSTILLRQQPLVRLNSSSPLENTIVSIEYRERNVGVFAQAGFEQFPIYEVGYNPDGTQSLTLHQQLWWVGGGLRAYLPLDDDNLLLRSIRPVAAIMLGTSAYGVLGRAELGVVWEPLPHVGVQWLLEGMVHSHGVGTNWEHAEKLGGSIGLVFRF